MEAVWTADELGTVDAADELRLASRRRDGTLRSPVTIWVVRHDDDLYVRSVKGRAGSWFRGTQVRHEGRISAGGVEKDVTFVDPDDDVIDQIDDAYRRKYRRYAQSIVGSVLTPELYLLAHVALRLRLGGGLGHGRPIAAILLLGLLPVTRNVPALTALGLVAAVCVALIGYEAIRYREGRAWIRSRRGAFTMEEAARSRARRGTEDRDDHQIKEPNGSSGTDPNP
jgi:hypothetical protein